MQTTLALVSLAAVAYAYPQAVTSDISPSSPPPAGCSESYNGEFQITIVNATTSATTERSFNKRAECGAEGLLTVKLADGKLTDSNDRTGYIASNYQFQFDAPPQAGAIYTDGFSSCANGSLALGGSNIFYQCYSGGFYNLYDRHWAAQCEPVYIDVLTCTGGSASNAASAPAVSQVSDGQPQGTTAIPVSQYTDGQPQVLTSMPAPVSQISDGQVQATSAAAPVSQISDGQVQATSAAAPVSQISDGQVQGTSAAAPVSQISDGQVQATSAAAPVSQISDGQVQATSAAAPVSQISDGQVQATSAAAPVSQISDGQIQATATGSSNTTATSTPVPFIGAGNGLGVKSSFAVVAAGAAAVLFL